MTAAQILAVVIFVVMFILIILDKIERQYVTLGCGLLTIILVFGVCMHSGSAIMETLNVQSIFTLNFWKTTEEAGESAGIDWATIIFIAGMMVMVEGMARAGFFRWLCMSLAKLAKYKRVALFVVFMCLSFVLAMFIDSITVILFLAAVTVELARLLKFNPLPMILTEIFCANLGGSATMCGDPPNIIIGSKLGYSFFDFLSNTGLAAFISLIVVIVYFYFAFRKDLKSGADDIDIRQMPDPKSAITDKKSFIISSIIFACAVVLLVSHSATHLTVAFIGLFIAAVTILTSIKHVKEIMKGVDYKTLLFFIGLFIVVGGLEQTEILVMIANFIEKISGGNWFIMVAIIIWISGIASAFVDNIPFAATMVPVISSLAATSGIPLDTLAWSLAVGTDIGGSATPIGASANVVGTSVAAKEGYPVGWGKYCAKLAPATILVLLIGTGYIFIRYVLPQQGGM